MDHPTHRLWMYKKGQWPGPIVSTGADEYGNSTVVLRLPGERALSVTWNIPLRRELELAAHRIEYGIIRWRIVRREVRRTPWEDAKEP